MIGEHYTDETNESRESIPIIVCRLEYTCKRCGKTFQDISIPLRGYDSEVGIMNDALIKQKRDDPYYPQDVELVTSHFCGDGFGMAEYVGLTFKRSV